MAQVIERDVTSDPAVLKATLANVNANLAFWLENPERCVHLVATAHDQVIGVILVKDFWNLCSLFVESSEQGRGIGRMLVESAAERCRGRSDKRGLLLNAAANAIPFYRKLGFFERTSSQPLPAGFMAMIRPQ